MPSGAGVLLVGHVRDSLEPSQMRGVVGEPPTPHSRTGKDSEPDSMDGVPTSLTFSAHLKHELSHCFDFPGLILECPGSWGP